jgi:hypothetical protein
MLNELADVPYVREFVAITTKVFNRARRQSAARDA